MGEPKPLTAYQQTYHWRNKNCGPWAREWIKKSVPGIKVEDGKQRVEVDEVTSVSGDCDLGQRKGKLLTIYDLEVELSWTGSDAEGSEVKGKIKCPEVSHEAIDGLSEYVYEITITTPSPANSSANALSSFVRSDLLPRLSEKFNSLRPALLEAHGGPSDEATSGVSTPQNQHYSPAPPGSANASSTTSATGATAKSAPVTSPSTTTPKPALTGTKVVEVKAELQASAADLWGLLTDQSKIPMWSRAEAKFSPSPDSSYTLFGGNVTGKIVSAEAPTKLVTTWQLKKSNWPSDHFATMTIVLDQGSNSTNVTFTLDGVPAGQEGELENALDGFYIRG
ncbi:putative chaperone activator [Kockovaella imperatae]|uniref:Putative chaperone activator n=1 Tax=Kockovaella imperatae TaxID=4999 RepID=A0A1Y1UGX7_9TREE|nr:putative chaperone activator [Kockovaella imperatae]ORX36754.1 putative chaperone activator [Kockovaella imperatae]